MSAYIPFIIIELKWEKSVRTAIDQILDKKYGSRFAYYFGDILLVGISYSKTDGNKKHHCKILKVNKNDNKAGK